MDISKLIANSKPASHFADLLPASLANNLNHIISPLWKMIINSSLSTGVMPDCLKLNQVTPLLNRKTGSDPDDHYNFKPVSNLPFLAKILENCILLQLNQHIDTNNLLDSHQSGFRKGCSTETAILNITDDIHKFMDAGRCCLLILLDPSAAFDTVNHKLLLNTLKPQIGANGRVL